MRPHLRDRTVLVTGGAGFIGSHLVNALVPENDVRVLDDFSTGRRDHIPDDVELIRGDIRQRATLARAIAGTDIVFHTAARSSVDRSIEDPYQSHQVNSAAALQLLELARREDARVIVSSSSAIYGDPQSVPLAETSPKQPTSPYGVQKLTLDHYTRLYNEMYGLDTVALRYFNVYGPRQRRGTYAGVISTFLEQARNDDPLTIHGDGLQTRDFVHVDDVVRANLLAATTDHVGEAFNVGTGSSVTIAELASIVTDVTGNESGIVHETAREGDVPHSRADVSKANTLLGFRPETDLHEGLQSLCTETEIQGQA